MSAAKTFWMISGTGCGAPTVRHGTYEAAEAEAKRLARSNPGVEFVILAARKSFQKNEFDTVDYGEPAAKARSPFSDLFASIVNAESGERHGSPFSVFIDDIPIDEYIRGRRAGRGGTV